MLQLSLDTLLRLTKRIDVAGEVEMRGSTAEGVRRSGGEGMKV